MLNVEFVHVKCDQFGFKTTNHHPPPEPRYPLSVPAFTLGVCRFSTYNSTDIFFPWNFLERIEREKSVSFEIFRCRRCRHRIHSVTTQPSIKYALTIYTQHTRRWQHIFQLTLGHAYCIIALTHIYFHFDSFLSFYFFFFFVCAALLDSFRSVLTLSLSLSILFYLLNHFFHLELNDFDSGRIRTTKAKAKKKKKEMNYV